MPTHGLETPTDSDLAWLKARLGRNARGMRGVATRSADGHPSVIVTSSLLGIGTAKVRPFPTVYWLVEPALSTRLARLEMIGWIERLQDKVDSTPELHEGIIHAQERYVKKRIEMLSEDEVQWLASHPAIDQRMRTVGISGMREKLAVKCLHAQYAWHLISPTTVGRLIDEIEDFEKPLLHQSL